MRQIRQGNTLYQTQMVCDVCEGKRFVIPEGEKCENCLGGKVVKDSKVLAVEIERGMQWGQQLAFYGEADQFPDIVTGDVIFQLKPKSDPHFDDFEREGNDLVVKKEISLGDALCGAKMILKHLDQREILISCPHGEIVSPGEKRKVAGQGMLILNRPEQYGDLFVVLTIVMPKALTQSQLDTIRNILPPTKPPPADPAVKLQMKKMTEKEQRKRQERMDEDQDPYGRGGGGEGVQCAQQ